MDGKGRMGRQGRSSKTRKEATVVIQGRKGRGEARMSVAQLGEVVKLGMYFEGTINRTCQRIGSSCE